MCPEQRYLNQEGVWRLMGIFSENRPEYVLVELACLSDSVVSVPIPTRAADYASVQQ
jgi:long-subunit acyl-CoA synthetase (AMP-forming)